MIPELGQLALSLALIFAFIQAFAGVGGAWMQNRRFIRAAMHATHAQALSVVIAFGCLITAFVGYDYSVAYVAQHSNYSLPLLYRIAASWGGHEGSVLLWALVLAGWTIAVYLGSARVDDQFRARVIGVMGMISSGFLLFILLTSNPFVRLLPAMPDGMDLNPLLQDPGMALHPPLLYAGYVGLTVPFAFAVAALLSGRVDVAWTRWTRPWTLGAWIFLTLGITLGSWWAYHELGWGGWWFWDPVENASFMPWLIATALIHSLAVTEQRGAFRAWTLLLCIAGFSLSLIGTFLVRSGVLVSVHAFANDPERGVFVLIFLLLVTGGALALFAWRAPRISDDANFNVFSRETALLVNNVLLVAAAAAIFLGTLYPLLLDGFGLGKISVGPPYFDQVFSALMLPLLALMGCGPLLRWNQDRWQRLWQTLRWPLLAAVVMGTVLTFSGADTKRWWLVLASLSIAIWIVLTMSIAVFQRLRSQRSLPLALRSLPRAFIGMVSAHLGIAVFTIGVVFANTWSTQTDLQLAAGDSYSMAGYDFDLIGIRQISAANYVADIATIRVRNGDTVIAMLHPEKRHYLSQSNPMTEAAVHSSVFRDLYIALGKQSDNAWTMRIHHKPLIFWLWLGPVLMAIGGALAISDRRYQPSPDHESITTDQYPDGSVNPTVHP